MPDIQVNPTYSTIPVLEEAYLPDYKLLGFQDNVLTYLAGSIFSGGGGGCQILMHHVDGTLLGTAGYLHLTTVNELSAFVLLRFLSGTSPRLFAAMDIDWDGSETISIAGRYALFATEQVDLVMGDHAPLAAEDIQLRADAHTDPTLHGVKRLRLNCDVIPDGCLFVLLYQGSITNPTFVPEYQSAE